MLKDSVEDNALTALAWSETLAPKLALRVTKDDFSTQVYRRIAEVALQFLEQHNRPAKAHISDLLERDLKRGNNEGRFMLDVLTEMEKRAPDLSDEFVMGGLDHFLIKQKMTRAVENASAALLHDDLEGARHSGFELYNTQPITTTLPDPWEQPTPPAFDPDILPDTLKHFVNDRARSMGVDAAGLFWSAMSCCSAALNGSTRLQMKKYDPSFKVPPGIWTLLFGDPSIGRSPTLHVTWGVLKKKNQEEIDENLRKRIWDAEEPKDRGPEPEPLRYVTNSATIESLQGILSKQDRGIAVVLDEWSHMIGSFEKYGGKGAGIVDRAFYLQGYDGGSYMVDRIGRGTVPIKNLHLTVCGGIQPERLRELGKLTTDGLLQRTIPVIMRPRELGVDEEPAGREVGNYEALVEHLAAIEGDRVVQLSPAASKVRQQVEERLRPLEFNNALGGGFRTFAGKLHGLWGRLTLVLGHVMQNVPDEIDVGAAELAEELIFNQVLPHGAKFYQWLAGGGDVEVMQAIVEWLVAYPRARIVASDLTNNVRACHGLPARQMAEVVSPLVTMGWLEPENPQQPTPNKWIVNQRIYTQFAERGEQARHERAQIRELIEASVKQAASAKPADDQESDPPQHKQDSAAINDDDDDDAEYLEYRAARAAWVANFRQRRAGKA